MKGKMKQLDHAIDQMNISEVEKQLATLEDIATFKVFGNDSELFARRIIIENRREVEYMNKSFKKYRILVACLVLLVTLGVTAGYASGLFSKFKFYNETTTVEIRTDQNINNDDAQRMAQDAEADYYEEHEIVDKPTVMTYSSIEETEEAVGLKIVIPSYIPKDFRMEDGISVYDTLDNNYNIYVTYTSKVQENRMLGVTIITQNYKEGSTVVTVRDSVYQDDYITPSGNHFTMLSEDGCEIASIDMNKMQYALIFMGVAEEEMYQVIDSIDLGLYGQ